MWFDVAGRGVAVCTPNRVQNLENQDRGERQGREVVHLDVKKWAFWQTLLKILMFPMPNRATILPEGCAVLAACAKSISRQVK